MASSPLPTDGAPGHGALMDAQYRWQRHVYDLSRKYYLLGRDALIRDLAPPPGGTVLEIGCGTGRNLALAELFWPDARLYGLDISAEMLKSARANVPDAKLGRGDATRFDAQALFGQAAFDRIFLSYTLSMIPGWQAAIDQAARLLAPGGSLHIVDFGQQQRLPRWFARGLKGWLHRFHVTPRDSLCAVCDDLAARHGLLCVQRSLYRDYAWAVDLRRPDDQPAAASSFPSL